MSRSSSLFVSSVVLALAASGAQAQQATPAEFPPTSFQGTQYVDSQGCAFIRAGRGALVNWVPRVDRARNQLCGFQPSLRDAAITVSAPAGPIITFDDPPATVAAAPAPVRAASDPGAPIQTVASLFSLPQLIAPVATADPIAAPAPAPIAAPARPTTTFAQACEGLFGVQAGFISGTTGEPIDCGPAPVVAAAPAPVPAVIAPPAAPSITLAQACDGRFGVQAGFVSASTGQPINCGPAPAAPILTAAVSTPMPAPVVTGPRRVTLDQICAEIAATGKSFTDAATGQPVACPAPAPTLVPTILAAAVNTGPAAPGTPGGAFTPVAPAVNAPASGSAAATCEGYSLVSGAYFVGATGLPARCGPQTQSPSGTEYTRRARAPFAAPVVPASNPTGAAARVEPVRPPSGYDRVWGDGRLNANRGLRRITPAQAAAEGILPTAANTAERVSSRSAPAAVRAPAAASADRYVQVASFSDHGRANSLASQFQAKGWPVTFGNTTRNGQQIKVVILGPFGGADALRTGLNAARAAGFGDAFTRN